VRRLLARCGALAGDVLDVPCGAARLRPTLEALGRYHGVDISAAMLAAVQRDGRLLRASAWSLPFVDDAFELVLCCRLLHHLETRAERAALLRELTRVTRRFVVASFWDAGSWHAWRRRSGRRRGHDARVAVPRTEVEALLEQAGARALAFAHSFRFVSQQAFVLAEKG
jgi:SAM-dependent methyltransferase